MSLVAPMPRPLPLHHIPDDDDSDVESDRYTNMSTDRFSCDASSSSRTSVDYSMRSSSPTLSVFSVTSSLRAQAITHEHGRGINTRSEVYRLPADEEELDRLNAQHEMLKKVTGKYPPPLPNIMVDDIPGESKAILDLGCGSGRWIMEAAADFPECSAVAVDLVPMQSVDMPDNCRSEMDDINIGLEHFYGSFNVVHARLICTGINNYENLVSQISNVLRPGGLVEMLEFDFQIYDEHKQLIAVSASSTGAPWLPRWMKLAYIAAGRRGGCLDAAGKLYEWVTRIPVFENVVHTQFWTPSSPWLTGDDPETKRLNELALLMSQDIKEFLRAGRTLLLSSGLPETFVDELAENSRREIEDARTPYYILLERVYATRR